MTRREFGRMAALAPASAMAAGELVLREGALELRLRAGRAKTVSRRLSNGLTKRGIDLPAADFSIHFDDGLVLAPPALSVKSVLKTERGCEILYSAKPAEVRVTYTLAPGKAYLRKQTAVRLTDAKPRRLMRAELENWRGVPGNWDSMHADSLPYGSHPIFCEDIWAGVEFVAAFNEYGKDGFVLRSRPGGKRAGREWFPLRSVVIGIAEPGRVRDAFLDYIEDVRLAPPRWVACYNSWWTLPKEVKQADYLALMRDLKEKLWGAHGVFFDIVATDAGWSDPQSIWQVDRRNLPNGFDDMRAIVESAGGKAGLWMSPSEEYSLNFDYDWGARNGYTVLKNTAKGPWRWNRAVSLADPRYREQTKAQLARLIRENGFDHIKYDGFAAREEQGHHDLLPGEDSVEPLAEYSLELIQASKAANPRLVTEPTYLNSWANYISPWIIKYADTVWANSGGDCPLGLGPAPDYRESHTNAREYFIFASLNEVWLPQNALQYFDIVHCDKEPGFANHAAMAVGRGRFFLSTYLNPKFMSQDDWRIYAGLLRWARKNVDLLRNTRVYPSRVETGEPYLYAHWLGQRGVLVLRNPSNETRDYTFELGKTGAPALLKDAVCYAQYPYRKGIAAGLSAASDVRLTLAPWELLFLEVVPRADLREPIALGGRWFRDPKGALSIAPERGAGRVLLIDPARGERAIPVNARPQEQLAGKIVSRSVRPLPESEWLAERGKPAPTVAFEIECSLSVPADASEALALLLVEFPGRRHRPSRCAARIGGAEATLEHRSSAGHIGYYMPTPTSPWKEVMPYESEWSWYIAELKPGASRVQFAGAAADPQVRLRVWAWADFDLQARSFTLDTECPEADMPSWEPFRGRVGVRL